MIIRLLVQVDEVTILRRFPELKLLVPPKSAH